MVDIDLSSIGLPWPISCVIVTGYEEMGFLTDQEYYPKHLAFQNSLLERPAIYLSEFFNQRYESQARSNIQSTRVGSRQV